MLSKSITFVLQANVCQMNSNVLVLQIVFKTGQSEIALFEKINVEFCGVIKHMYKGPHSYIKLTLFIKKGSFYILLDYPLWITWLFLDERNNLPNLTKHLDSTALICSCRFQNPLIILAMFLRQVFWHWHSFSNMDVGETFFELVHVALTCLRRRKNKSWRQNICKLHKVIPLNQICDLKINLHTACVFNYWLQILQNWQVHIFFYKRGIDRPKFIL